MIDRTTIVHAPEAGGIRAADTELDHLPRSVVEENAELPVRATAAKTAPFFGPNQRSERESFDLAGYADERFGLGGATDDLACHWPREESRHLGPGQTQRVPMAEDVTCRFDDEEPATMNIIGTKHSEANRVSRATPNCSSAMAHGNFFETGHVRNVVNTASSACGRAESRQTTHSPIRQTMSRLGESLISGSRPGSYDGPGMPLPTRQGSLGSDSHEQIKQDHRQAKGRESKFVVPSLRLVASTAMSLARRNNSRFSEAPDQGPGMADGAFTERHGSPVTHRTHQTEIEDSQVNAAAAPLSESADHVTESGSNALDDAVPNGGLREAEIARPNQESTDGTECNEQTRRRHSIFPEWRNTLREMVAPLRRRATPYGHARPQETTIAEQDRAWNDGTD